MHLQQTLLKTTLAVGLILLTHSAIRAQSVEGLSFSRGTTGEVSVGELEFTFDDSDTEFEIDQLGAVTALFLNNDGIGQEVGFNVGSPVVGIGEVFLGDTLTPGSDFGGNDFVDIASIISPGEEFFLGFGDGTDVGFFNVSWGLGTNSSITISNGLFASDGASVVVAAVPEPTAAGIVSIFGALLFVRRRRS